jgi:hypothetical protein
LFCCIRMGVSVNGAPSHRTDYKKIVLAIMP